MGTRNLTIVRLDGETKIAQYGQWDGYPIGGLGAGLLEVLRGADLGQLKELVAGCEWLNQKEIDKINELANLKEDYHYLSRDVAGDDLLEFMLKAGESLKLVSNEEFADDSLFCEWCYVVDFDLRTFEVFKGFNGEPLSENERFYKEDIIEEHNGYYAVKLVKLYDLDKLPSAQTFDKDFRYREEEE